MYLRTLEIFVLIEIDMLLMVEKGITEGICHSIDMQKLITDTRKIMIKVKNRHIFNIGM